MSHKTLLRKKEPLPASTSLACHLSTHDDKTRQGQQRRDRLTSQDGALLTQELTWFLRQDWY